MTPPARYPIIDGHSDALMVFSPPRSVPVAGFFEHIPGGQIDLPTAGRAAMQMVANLFRIEALSAGRVRVVRTVADMEACLHDDVLGAVLHFEGAEPIDEDLDALEVYYRAGLRSLGIVWSRPTIFGHGVPFKFPRLPDTGPGLTDAALRKITHENWLRVLRKTWKV